jgi:hypothetical protein
VRLALAAAAVLLLAACGPGAPGAGEGSARLVDDTGRPDVPDGGGWVALVPAERAQDLWDAAGSAPGDDLGAAAVPLTRELVESVGGLARTVSEDGDFELGLTGSVLVCRVPGDGDTGTTRGCATTGLTADESLVVTWGEGGLGFAS